VGYTDSVQRNEHRQAQRKVLSERCRIVLSQTNTEGAVIAAGPQGIPCGVRDATQIARGDLIDVGR